MRPYSLIRQQLGNIVCVCEGGGGGGVRLFYKLNNLLCAMHALTPKNNFFFYSILHA